MRILIDITYITPHSFYHGVSNYIWRVLKYIRCAHKQQEFILLYNHTLKPYIQENYADFDCYDVGNAVISKIPILRVLVLPFLCKHKIHKLDVDAVFCPWGSFGCILRIKPKRIVVIHDLQTRIDEKAGRRFFEVFVQNSIMKNADYIVTISEFSKKQLFEFFPLACEKVYNLGNSVAMPVYSSQRIHKADYILYVGRLDIMKNVMTLLKAFNQIRGVIDYDLVLIGKKTKYYEKVMEPYIQNNGLQSRIFIYQNCTEEELGAFYRYAKLFVFPSLREGFGSPPIEAAIYGCPFLTSNCEALPEVTSGKGEMYEHVLNQTNLAQKIVYCLKNPKSDEELKATSAFFNEKYGIMTVGKNIVDFLENVATQK